MTSKEFKRLCSSLKSKPIIGFSIILGFLINFILTYLGFNKWFNDKCMECLG